MLVLHRKIPEFSSRFLTRLLIIFVLLAAEPGVWAGNGTARGFAALAEYDYFSARKKFYANSGSKENFAAFYGLAIIYMRTDNPFHQLDSACKYVNRSFNTFRSGALPFSAAGFNVDSVSIRKLADTISYRCWLKLRESRNIEACNHFLLSNYLGRKKLIYDVVYLRDELEFNQVMERNSSDTTRAFITMHPQSLFLRESMVLLDRQLFDEETRSGSAASYISFIRRYPRSQMLNTAYEKLFAMYRQNKDTRALADFVHNYPLAPQNLDAWKLLFTLTVKSFSSADLKKFIEDYPKFPLKSTILKEMELNSLQLFPVQMGDFTGFIDSKGRVVIRPQFDEASEFSEGLAVVSRNDSVFFINKENMNPFGRYYSSATPFRNGIAAVKQGGKYFFINRLGQLISKQYEEIGELSDNVYVIRQDGLYGALDQFGQTLIEPQFEKLGDFRNGYAYYARNGLYGFVTREGAVHQAEYEWIGDFDADHLAVMKMKGRYGIVNGNGRQILEPGYDQVMRTGAGDFMLVLDNLYGFYSGRECFIALPVYDYRKEIPAADYAAEGLYRLIRKEGATLADANGRQLFAPGTYEEFGLPADGLIRVRQKKKYGYLDRRMTISIPAKYQQASDFVAGTAIVSLRDQHMIIDRQGNVLYSSPGEISRQGNLLFSVEDEQGMRLIRSSGETVAEAAEEVRPMKNGNLLLVLRSGEMRVIQD